MKIPTLTYPLVVDTVGKFLAIGDEIHVHCYQCRHRGRINLVALAQRKGMDQRTGHDALVRLFYCPECRRAGRPDRDIGFSHVIAGGHSVIERDRPGVKGPSNPL